MICQNKDCNNQTKLSCGSKTRYNIYCSVDCRLSDIRNKNKIKEEKRIQDNIESLISVGQNKCKNVNCGNLCNLN